MHMTPTREENDPCVRNAKRVDDVREEFVCVTGQMTDVALCADA